MRADDVFALVAISILLLLGLYLFFRSILRILPRVVWVAGTPTSPIRSLPLGLVEVTGNVKLDEIIISPATGLECCLTKYKKQELRVRRTRNGETTSWETIESGFRWVPFFLHDNKNCKILVDPARAELVIPSETYYPDTGIPLRTIGAIRYLEQAIYLNNLIYVLGEVKKKPCFADLQDEVGTRLAIVRGDREKMAALDENKDGQVDMMEWEKTVRETEKEVTDEMITAAQNPNDTILISNPSSQRPFIISTRSEKDVLGHLRWKGYSLLVLGLALVFFNLSGILGFYTGNPPFGKNYYKMIKLILERND